MFMAGAILPGVVSGPRLSRCAPLLHGGHSVEASMYKGYPAPAEDGSAAPGMLASVRLGVSLGMLQEFLNPTDDKETSSLPCGLRAPKRSTLQVQ